MRTLGQTFASEDLGWMDFESAGPVEIRDGTFRYMREAAPLIFSCAVGDDAVVAYDMHKGLGWRDLPKRIRDFHKRVQAGKAKWVAHHAAFDREVWNQITDFPQLEVEHVIDSMAQAMAAGLPGTLDGAGRASRSGRKIPAGKDLIKLFCEQGAAPEDHPMEWAAFLDYAVVDVEVMRDVFRCTLQLPIEDWEEYWVSEKINLAGIRFDRKLAERAASMAAIDKHHAAAELAKLTDNKVDSVGQVKRMIDWLNGILDVEGRKLLTRREEEFDENDELIKPAKYSLNRRRIQLLLAFLADRNRTPDEDKAYRLLMIRQYGGSTTPAKFSRMLDSYVEDDELLGMFRFNGASQTGRFSSQVVQLHNLMRDALPYEPDAIDALAAGCDYQTFAKLGDDTPVSRKLSMLIRPTLIPKDDNAFVWGDWEQIEARVLPWLSNSPGGEARLQIFRDVDADPSLPDLYTRTAATLSGLPIEQVTKPIRQRGKVTELACGFGGGVGALQAMAASYGMHLTDALAKETVTAWRAANQWAYDFWEALWYAAKAARENPGQTFHAGRISYIFLKHYLDGTLLCILPSGRAITYRAIRYEMVDVLDDDGVVIDSKLELTFARGYGRVKLWPGMLAENVTQAASACVLRGTLVRLKKYWVRAHTHDEILLETPAHAAEQLARQLVEVMERGFEWTDGLPLKAEASMGYAYSKCEEALGL